MLTPDLIERLRGRVMVLTGAGISVASGISPFRGDGGLYEGLNPYELASPQAFRAKPVTVWNWYLMRISQAKNAKPNAAHLALTELEKSAEHFTILTSNVDSLHEQAGSNRIFHFHGKILEFRCKVCRNIENVNPHELPESVTEETLPRCDCGGLRRPNVVWFGEHPWPEAFETFAAEIKQCDLFLEIGTSGMVSYGFTEDAFTHGVPTIVINPEPTGLKGMHFVDEKAEIALPKILEQLRSSN